MSIPISTVGDSRPMIKIKHALPLALPHCRFEVLSFPSYLERFAMCAVDDPLERLQGTPLGAELPPHRESHAGHRGAGVDEAKDWDALEVELAGDGWS